MLIGAQHLQNIHPLVVHFPIAFLMGAALFYFLAWLFKKEDLAKTGFWLLILGALTLVISVATGLRAEQGVMVSLSVRDNLLKPHKIFMIATALIGVTLMIWAIAKKPFPKNGRVVFLILFFVMLGVMTLGADYGGRMVYDYNAGGNACHQPILFTK